MRKYIVITQVSFVKRASVGSGLRQRPPPARRLMVFEQFIRYAGLAVGLMVFEQFIRYAGLAVGRIPR